MRDLNVSKVLRDDVANRLGYHPVNSHDQAERYQDNRDAAIVFASILIDNAQSTSRELSLALTAIQEALMWGNAAIACNEPS